LLLLEFIFGNLFLVFDNKRAAKYCVGGYLVL